jgi:hypothetical protein
MTVSDDRLGMGPAGEALPGIAASGWYVAGTWVLTGERKDGRVNPENSVFGDGYGALELVRALERLSFASATTAAVPTARSSSCRPPTPTASRPSGSPGI